MRKKTEMEIGCLCDEDDSEDDAIQMFVDFLERTLKYLFVILICSAMLGAIIGRIASVKTGIYSGGGILLGAILLTILGSNFFRKPGTSAKIVIVLQIIAMLILLEFGIGKP